MLLHDEEPEAEASAATVPSAGGETVLVVDDDEEVRTLACGILRLQGYVVLEAATPGEALAICEERKERIDLLLTDVVMPVMSGRELADRVRPMRPEPKIMHISGYPGDVLGQHGVLASGSFVQKPFTAARLSEKVREAFAG